jgi:hypothetical protein
MRDAVKAKSCDSSRSSSRLTGIPASLFDFYAVPWGLFMPFSAIASLLLLYPETGNAESRFL